ncbi:MAG: YicC family protein [Akkermansiaceae bacterium]|nr:YicC family protein [Akkermansiaceae bacterium]
MHSMTGFGRGHHATDQVAVRVEVSSVNRKQCEVSTYTPRNLTELDPQLRKHVLSRVSRGRINVQIKLEHPEGLAAGVQVDTARARALEAAFTELSDAINRPLHPTSTDFLRAPDVFSFEEDVSVEAIWEAILPALDQALDALLAMRAKEGAHLRVELDRLLTLLEVQTSAIEKHAPEVVTAYRENLHRRLREAGLDLDLEDERVLKELALFADRCDITEEITRLRSHFRKFASYLDSPEPVGRPLDFLCQEMNREFNTIGSKSNDASLAQHVVNAKTELEKAREQVQNIE